MDPFFVGSTLVTAKVKVSNPERELTPLRSEDNSDPMAVDTHVDRELPATTVAVNTPAARELPVTPLVVDASSPTT